MPKGYWIARVTVHDPETYKKYIEADAAAFAQFNARFLVRGGRYEAMEGTSRERNVVIEFASYDEAVACYHSPAYQKALAFRKAAAVSDLLIIEGTE